MSATPRDIRRLAFQTLFQLDLRGELDVDLVQNSLDELESLTVRERKRAFELAAAAYAGRKQADAAMLQLAPGWPAHRQPAVDRAILRLAHHELQVGKVHPAIIVDEAIELAKEFSTDKSPAFVNGLLDKVLKQVLPAWLKAHPNEDGSSASNAMPPEDFDTPPVDAPEAAPNLDTPNSNSHPDPLER